MCALMSGEPSISGAEYEQRRSSFELCCWVNEKLRELRQTGKFDALYFERTRPKSNIKNLIGEVIPISRLGLYFSTPGSEVYVTCFADDRGYDAEIETTGFNPRRFKVEVTTTETPESVLRRQALSRYGHVSLTGSIRRHGREIVDEPEMINVDEEDRKCTELMLDRLRAKVESRRYDDNTAILVYLTEFRSISMYHRAELIRQTQLYLLQNQARVAGVYFCHMADYSIDAVRVRHS